VQSRMSLTEGSIPRALLAIAGAVSSMAAQNVGAQKWDRVGTVALAGVTYNLVLGGSLIAFIYLPLFMLIISLWCIRVPFAFLMLKNWAAEAIWWSFPLASLTSLIMAISYYRFGGWRKLRLGVAEANAAAVPGV